MEPLPVIKSAEFETSAVRPVQFPAGDLPEVAFAGRSNVGKSSLINCLVQRRKLVRTSRTPGQTQTINFFRINGLFYFVDLPGYGYAKVSLNVRAQWGPMVEKYLIGRQNLRGVVQILDSRHPPTPDDLKLWNWLQESRIPAIPVLTKADKIGRARWESCARQASLSLGVPRDRLILFSAESRQGRGELLTRICEMISPPDATSPPQQLTS